MIEKIINKLFDKFESKFQFDYRGSTKVSQLSLQMHYRYLLAQNISLPRLSDVGFRIYSQTDEDGIILFLFSVISTTNKIFVEIGTGDCIECNCANLV